MLRAFPLFIVTFTLSFASVAQPAPPVHAQEQVATVTEPFTPERFEELQAEGALILLDVFADWCPTCAKQQTVLADFREAHPDVPLNTLTIDFDKQKKWVKEFKAPRQSTLILYRGSERVWFSVAETDPEAIFAEIQKASASE